MGKKRGPKREKIPHTYRSVEERRADSRPIIEKLTELRLTTEYEEVVTLMKAIQRYINEGERIELNIPFPAIGRRITGVLATNHREQVWVKMEKEKF